MGFGVVVIAAGQNPHPHLHLAYKLIVINIVAFAHTHTGWPGNCCMGVAVVVVVFSSTVCLVREKHGQIAAMSRAHT